MLGERLKGTAREALSRRFLLQGGIVERTGGTFRTDATAWGILTFQAADGSSDLVERHRARLMEEQTVDGWISVDRRHPDSFWPTALAVLAWHGSPHSQEAKRRAVHFLLSTTGVHPPHRPDEPAAHDTQLKGWPWVAGTHSWIEPTVLALIALRVAGYGQGARAREGLRMILDRQLPHGGWNYGNTLVFGRELRPMPESTGAALTVLAGQVDGHLIGRSVRYLQDEIGRLRTPISLGWGLLGLGAWGVWPSNGIELVERCLSNQSRYGEYGTSALSLLLLAGIAGAGGTPSVLFGETTNTRTAS